MKRIALAARLMLEGHDCHGGGGRCGSRFPAFEPLTVRGYNSLWRAEPP